MTEEHLPVEADKGACAFVPSKIEPGKIHQALSLRVRLWPRNYENVIFECFMTNLCAF
ncbi:hypothetical protein ACE1TI_16115 [Alteribacillus sp. JSM 102045]|uniref:hypothetical protein n=1 Tax=Alteribacillus sp. JSM 102045 TaxID=1562101 RepID=UPI0035BFEFF7